MSDVDLSQAAPAVRREVLERRTERPRTEKTLSESAAVFFMKVEALQGERDTATRQLAEANARIEQFESTVTALRSEIETLKIKYDQERDKRIRLQECLGTFQRALDQVKDVEDEEV